MEALACTRSAVIRFWSGFIVFECKDYSSTAPEHGFDERIRIDLSLTFKKHKMHIYYYYIKYTKIYVKTFFVNS